MSVPNSIFNNVLAVLKAVNEAGQDEIRRTADSFEKFVSYPQEQRFIKHVVEYLRSRLPVEVPTATPIVDEPMMGTGPAYGGPPMSDMRGAYDEQDEFEVVISSIVEGQKIEVIKVLRRFLDVGIKEAKEMTEELPKVVKDGLSRHDATSFRNALSKAGASVLVK